MDELISCAKQYGKAHKCFLQVLLKKKILLVSFNLFCQFDLESFLIYIFLYFCVFMSKFIIFQVNLIFLEIFFRYPTSERSFSGSSKTITRSLVGYMSACHNN